MATCVALFSNAQGFEGLIVEKYYISEANDTSVNSIGGILPVGSVTYRIYADMLPGYTFQAVYGLDVVPVGPSVGDHEWRIETSTLFFNNEDRGATTPNAINFNYMDENTVMLDSWLSVGGAANNKLGVLKADDDGVATVMNNDNVLLSVNPLAGIPLTQEDGFISGTPGAVTFVGINSEVQMFDNQNDGTNGPVFSTYNGSLACLGGCVGYDSIDNKILIAQITTDGILQFEFNIQLGSPSGGTEQYVAKNPVGNEVFHPTLTYNSTVSIQNNNKHELFFDVFPVPARELVTIRLNIPGKSIDNKIQFFDVLGNIVLEIPMGAVNNNQRFDVPVSLIAKGLYFLKAEVDGKTAVQRIIVQ